MLDVSGVCVQLCLIRSKYVQKALQHSGHRQSEFKHGRDVSLDLHVDTSPEPMQFCCVLTVKQVHILVDLYQKMSEDFL